ncbi:hypothetical protein WA026_001891 [Henosepilachna vigintioctopunctata]|uniref:Uncharacterized protein n=1 Tax=Henosepilachna vigintioctopunctata TaxID=420089 RepID=A0AAW1US90_9CUCU
MPYLKDIVKLTAERGKTSLMYSTNYDQPASEELNFLQAKCVKKFPMPDRINKVRGFNKAKKKDIVEKPLKELNFLQAKCVKKFPMPDRLNKVRGFNKAKKKTL